MANEPNENLPQKSAAAVLLDAAKAADREHRKEIARAVKDFFDDPKFANTPKDFLSVAKDAMKQKAVFDPKSHLLTVGKKKMRNPTDWIEKKFPTLLKAADLPRGDVELDAAQQACQSLTMQAELVRAMGVQRTGELMALYGGAVGRLSKPLPIETAKDKQKSPRGRNNPFSQEGWNLTKAGKLIQDIGLGPASEIAKAVGSFPGETEKQARARWGIAK
jgi:hypothetical protein